MKRMIVVCLLLVPALLAGQTDSFQERIRTLVGDGRVVKCLYTKVGTLGFNGSLNYQLTLPKSTPIIIIASGPAHLGRAFASLFDPEGASIASGDLVNECIETISTSRGVYNLSVSGRDVAGSHAKMTLKVYAVRDAPPPKVDK